MTTPRRRITATRCSSCGGPADKDCVDNFGNPYKGCSSGCRIMSLEEINKILVAGGEKPIR